MQLLETTNEKEGQIDDYYQQDNAWDQEEKKTADSEI